MNLVRFLEYWAHEAPDKPALITPDLTFSYSELQQKVNQFATALKEIGVKPGDRVFSLLPNSLEFVVAFYGTLKHRAIFVPVNPDYQRHDLAVILPDCNPSLILAFKEKMPLLEEFLPLLTSPLVVFVDGDDSGDLSFAGLMHKGEVPAGKVVAAQNGVDPASDEPDDSDVAELIYTSGTTGEPKGAMLTHNGLARNAFVFSQTMKFSPDDVSLLMAPAFHIAAQTCALNVTIVSGGSVVVYKSWSLHRFFELFKNYGVTYFFGPPTLYIQILEACRQSGDALKTWRAAFSGAAPVPEEVFNRFREFIGFSLIEGYGLSETAPIVAHNPINGPQKPGSIGCAFPGVEIRIVDEDDHDLPPDEVGELVTRSPYLMRGYWNKPEETAEAMRGGWFHTGDLARVDHEGYYYIVDRKKDMINKGGCKVYPREVEELLFKYPGVLEVAVVGYTDPLRGEDVKAYIVPREGCELSLKELKKYCRENLASYKVPRHIELVAELPKTTSGKILRRLLRQPTG